MRLIPVLALALLCVSPALAQEPPTPMVQVAPASAVAQPVIPDANMPLPVAPKMAAPVVKQPGMVLPTANGAATVMPNLVPSQLMTLDGELPDGMYPILRLTPDKIEVIKLDKDATNVLVGNSKHLMAVMETARQVILVPRQPGATHLQVLDAKGNTIMQRSVIVAAPKQDYIRVRRACKNDTSGSCKEYSVFYCPDMCHTVDVTEPNSTTAPATVPTEAASNPAAANNGPAPGETINDGVPAIVPSGTAAPPVIP